jgi:hypothetical protein
MKQLIKNTSVYMWMSGGRFNVRQLVLSMRAIGFVLWSGVYTVYIDVGRTEEWPTFTPFSLVNRVAQLQMEADCWAVFIRARNILKCFATENGYDCFLLVS